jgi:hypothetical protein
MISWPAFEESTIEPQAEALQREGEELMGILQELLGGHP